MVYISPLKALAADVERNLRVPLAGIADMAQKAGVAVRIPAISMRTGTRRRTSGRGFAGIRATS